MSHPFRFGVQTSSAPDGKAWRDRARQVEDLGYSTLYIPDHFGDQWGPLVALTVAAEATTSLNVGALVFDNDYRHPVVLAKEIATLDIVSDGRVEFGIGAGWMISDYDESGIAYDRPGVRIDRLAEALEIFEQMWSTGSATFEGEHYRVTGAQGEPRPRTTPRPKILIGGGGKRVLSLAAKHADIIGINPSIPEGKVGPAAIESAKVERYRERLQWVKEAAGHRFDSIELQCLCFMVQVVDDRATALTNLAPLFGLSPDEAGELPLALVGSVDEICEQLEARRAELGISYWVVQEPALEDFAPVVARLAGT